MTSLGAALARLLGASAADPRVCLYYAPVAEFVRARVAEAAARPVFVGLSGPQGAGKSTLAGAVVSALGEAGLAGVALSIDDFYLTGVQQDALAARHPGHRFLEHRGYPGTHDIALGVATLSSLAAGKPTRLPAYDKGARAGRGDRAPEAGWRLVEQRLDFVLLEGWMLGFTPVAARGASCPAALTEIDANLAAYDAWHAYLTSFVCLRATSSEHIVEWRVDAERARRARGEGALSDADARDYIERFLPAYETYVPSLGPHVPTLTITLDRARAAVELVRAQGAGMG